MVTFTDAQVLAWLSAFLLPFFRILALMSSAPILSTRSVPMRARVALAALIAVAIAPTVNPPAAGLMSANGLLLVIAQVLIGLAIGFTARLVFAAFELAGEIIGLQMGLSYAGFFDPQAGSMNAIARTFSILALLTFVAMNGPMLLFGAILQSFTSLPIDGSAQAAPTTYLPWSIGEFIAMGSAVFATALSLALPLIAVLLFVNLLLGIVSRVAPQFNIFSIGFPVTIGCGLMMLAAGLPLIERPLTALTHDFLQLVVR